PLHVRLVVGKNPPERAPRKRLRCIRPAHHLAHHQNHDEPAIRIHSNIPRRRRNCASFLHSRNGLTRRNRLASSSRHHRLHKTTKNPADPKLPSKQTCSRSQEASGHDFSRAKTTSLN